jgi:hypothetical protein
MKGEGEGSHAWWPMEGERKAPHALWAMEGKGKGSFSPLFISPPTNFIQTFIFFP